MDGSLKTLRIALQLQPAILVVAKLANLRIWAIQHATSSALQGFASPFPGCLKHGRHNHCLTLGQSGSIVLWLLLARLLHGLLVQRCPLCSLSGMTLALLFSQLFAPCLRRLKSCLFLKLPLLIERFYLACKILHQLRLKLFRAQ